MTIFESLGISVPLSISWSRRRRYATALLFRPYRHGRYVADGVSFLQPVGIVKFGMDDKARLAKELDMGQAHDDAAEQEDSDDGDETYFGF